MLNLKDIAKEFETGLNTALGDKNVKFKIWVNAGQRTKPRRKGNAVTYFIDSILRPTASMNLGTLIDMGSWTLTLEGLVPIPPPRTSANPTDEEMQRVYEEQYNYALGIFGAVDKYFSIAENISITTEGGKTFSVGIRAGTSIAGLAELLHGVGEAVQLTVYIELGYTEGGVNSRLATIAIDTPENIVPSMATDINRENVLQNDVYAGETCRRSAASASAIAISLQLPLTDKTGQAYDFLVNGEINVAHFVYYTLNGKTTVYWMMVDSPVQSSREVTNIGINYNLIEATNDPELVNLSAGYHVARAEVNANTVLFFTVEGFTGEKFAAKVGTYLGYIVELDMISRPPSYIGIPVQIQEKDLFYDEETGRKYLYVIYYGNYKLSAKMQSIGEPDVPLVPIEFSEDFER